MSCPFHQNKPLNFWKKIVKSFQRKNSPGEFDFEKILNTTILNTTIDGIVTSDERGIIQSCNHEICKMFGYCEKELIGQNVSIFQPEPYRSEHDQYIVHYVSTGIKKVIGKRREVMAKRRNGEEFPVDLFMSEMFIDSKRFFLAIIRDVTERTQALIVKEKAFQMEAELKVKNDFLMMMSHELRTPLHAIMGFTEFLLKELEGPLNESQKSSLKQVYRAGEHLLGLINGLLELSKIDAKQRNLPMKLCNLVEIFEESIRNIMPLAQKKNLIIEKTISCPEWIIEANSGQIYQIFFNLLDNAIKFTPKGKVSVTLAMDLKEIQIIIQDTGIGIDEGDLDKVFIPFAQLKGQEKSLTEHTGLGLAITKQLVEFYKGRIEVLSKKGEGSTFTVFFPNTKKENSTNIL